MMTLKEIVETRLAELNIGPVEAAVQAGIERSYIRDIVKDRKKSVRQDMLIKLAEALQLDAAALTRNEMVRLESASGALKDSKAPLGYVPVMGKIAANTWISVDDMDFGYEDMEYVPSFGGYPREWQFGLLIEGNCLNKIARHGDRLVCLNIVKAGVDVVADDLVIVQRSRFEGQMIERTAKRIRQTSEGFELWPESTDPTHQEPIKLSGSVEGETVQIIGKVLWIVRKP